MKESAYAAVLGWKNALNVDPRVKQQATDEDAKTDDKADREAGRSREREQKMLAAFDIYINYIKDPKDDELVGMKFLKANIYRRYNHYDEALPIFQDILEHHSQHETAEYSANLLLDTLQPARQRYDELLALADKLDDEPEVPRGQGRPQGSASPKIKAQSMRKKAEQARDEGEGDQGLRQVRRVRPGATSTSTTATPRRPENDEVLYNAGVCFEEGKSIGAAIQMFNLLAEVLPELEDHREGDRPPRQGVRRHRVLRPRVGQARGVREEVRRREGRVRRDERRGVLPQGHRRRRQGDRGHQVLHQDVRPEEAGRGGERERSR